MSNGGICQSHHLRFLDDLRRGQTAYARCIDPFSDDKVKGTTREPVHKVNAKDSSHTVGYTTIHGVILSRGNDGSLRWSAEMSLVSQPRQLLLRHPTEEAGGVNNDLADANLDGVATGLDKASERFRSSRRGRLAVRIVGLCLGMLISGGLDKHVIVIRSARYFLMESESHSRLTTGSAIRSPNSA